MADLRVEEQEPISRQTPSATSTGPFSFSFAFNELDDIDVYIIDSNDDAVQLVYGVDYSVDGLDADNFGYQGGSVTLVTAITTSDVIAIVRSTERSRLVQHPMQGAVDILSFNEALSRIFMILNEITAILARTIQTPIYEDPGGEGGSTDCLQLPNAAARANKLLGFGSLGCIRLYDLTEGEGGGVIVDLESLGIPEAKNIYVQDTRPDDDEVALWIDTSSMSIYLLNYADGDSVQDVEIGPGPGIGGGGGNGSAYTIKEVTATTYSFILDDANGVWIEANNASPQTFTVPPESSIDFEIGQHIEVQQKGAGAVTFAAGAGVTINSKGGALTIGGQWVTVSLVKTAANTWSLVGDLQ